MQIRNCTGWFLIITLLEKLFMVCSRKFKGGIGSFFFHPSVNAMELPPYCRLHTEASYWTFGLVQSFGAIWAHNHYHVIRPAIINLRKWFSQSGKSNSHLLGGHRYKKIRRYRDSYITQDDCRNRIPPLNFLGSATQMVIYQKSRSINWFWYQIIAESVCSLQWYQKFILLKMPLVPRVWECIKRAPNTPGGGGYSHVKAYRDVPPK